MENNLEQQLRAVLSDPSAMQNILTMAQSLSGNGTQDTPPAAKEMLPMQQLAGLAMNSNIDHQQRSLLNALAPYLSNDRIRKLENAMRAAKMTRLASTLISGSR